MKSALILGATSDVAKALAAQLAAEGYELTLAGRNPAKLEPIKSDLEIRYNCKVAVLPFDALEFTSHGAILSGLKPLPNLTICVFGYLGDATDARTNWAEAKQIIDTNFTGAVSALDVIANEYEKQKNGTIVGISSVAGERGRQSNYHYGSAKAGFTTYLSGLRNRLTTSGVHVVTVKPGFINTSMTESMDLPKPLTASPEKVAQDILKAVKKKKNTIYTLGVWRLIMYIIKTIPEFVFKKLSL